MAAEEKKVTGIDETEAGFLETPEMTPIEKIEADSFIVSEAEIEKDMKDAGMEMVHAPEKAEVPVEETAIGLEETSFTAVPELTPLEQLGADEFIASPAEIEKDMKKAGI